jgi:hypothetical protein
MPFEVVPQQREEGLLLTNVCSFVTEIVLVWLLVFYEAADNYSMELM